MRQIKDRKGFSLTISVVFVLVAVMLTMVLVTAALSTMAQVKRSKDNKQSELTVTNTASALAGTIKGMKWTVVPPDSPVIGAGVPGGASDPDSPIKDAKDIVVLKDNQNPALAGALVGWIKAANESHDPITNPKKYKEYSLTLKESHDDSPSIKALVTVYGLHSDVYPGDIVVTLCMENTGGGTMKVPDNKMTFRIDGQCNYNGLTNGEYSFGDVTYYSGDKLYE